MGSEKIYLTVLTLNQYDVTEYAKSQGVSETDYAQIVQHQKVKDLIRDAFRVNRQLPSWETLKKFHIVADEFTVENGLLTPSLKVQT